MAHAASLDPAPVHVAEAAARHSYALRELVASSQGHEQTSSARERRRDNADACYDYSAGEGAGMTL